MGQEFRVDCRGRGNVFLLQINSIEEIPFVDKQLLNLAQLLNIFGKVCEEPNELLPSRTRDHIIKLKEGTSPICNRHYRYPYYQKAEIERKGR